MLVRHPGLSTTTVAALATGIGFTTVMFCIVYAVLIRDLPVEDGVRVVRVTLAAPSPGIPGAEPTIHDYLGWRAVQQTFEELAAYREGSANVQGPEGPVRYSSASVTANALAALRLEPGIGRFFREEDSDPDAAPTVLLSHRAWEELFGGSAEALGATVRVNGVSHEVIGVVPEGIRFPRLQDIWLPLPMNALGTDRATGAWLSVFGRLRHGVGTDGAAADLEDIAARLRANYPEMSPDGAVVVEPFAQAAIVDGVAPLFWAMLVIASLVLLIACANAANLFLLRAAARARETGTRRALGACRRQIGYRSLADATLLAVLGGTLGTGIAWAGIRLFDVATADALLPFWVTFEVDRVVLLFVIAISGAAGLTSGIPPALKAAGHSAGLASRSGFGGPARLRIGRLSRWMVAGELAMSMGLLVAAGVMTRSVATLKRFDYGFDHERVFTARVTVAPADLPAGEEPWHFLRAVRERIEAIPTVERAALGSSLPALGTPRLDIAIDGAGGAMAPAGGAMAPTGGAMAPAGGAMAPTGGAMAPAGGAMAYRAQVSPGYFSALGVGILEGRDFATADVADSAPVAIVNRSFATTHLADNAIGRRIRVGGSGSAAPWRLVVGVAPDLFMGGLEAGASGAVGVYTPLSQGEELSVYIVAAGPSDPLDLTSAVRVAVISTNANTPIHDAESMSDLLARETLFYRIFGTLFVVLGGTALLLAAIGLSVVASLSVRRQRTELGVRMILGAGRAEILRLILRQSLAPMGSGVVLGTGLGLVISRSLRLAIFEVSPYDPVSLVVAAVLLVGVGTLAVAIPALLAARINPVAALRTR